MKSNLKSNEMGLKNGIIRMKNKFNEYWPKFKFYALICMILDLRFVLYLPVNLNEKKEAKDYNSVFRGCNSNPLNQANQSIRTILMNQIFTQQRL